MKLFLKVFPIVILAALLAACAPAPSVVPIGGTPTNVPASPSPTPQPGGSTSYPPAGSGTVEPAYPPAGTPTTDPAYPLPGASDTLEITLADNGKTLTFHPGERFLLKLGEAYNWDIQPFDQTIVARVKNVMVIRGAQGLYDVLKTGQIELSATGDPTCRSAKPACAMPSILFKVTIVVE
jgi:hypothetical protein